MEANASPFYPRELLARDRRVQELIASLHDPELFASYMTSQDWLTACDTCETETCVVKKGIVGCLTCSVYHHQLSRCSFITNYRAWILHEMHGMPWMDAYSFVSELETLEEGNGPHPWCSEY
jgi:hypothetical protein